MALEMTSDMQGMMWGEPELSGLLAWDDVKVSQSYNKCTVMLMVDFLNIIQHCSFCSCHCEGC